MTVRIWKAAALALLILAVGSVVLALQASNDRVRIQGPSALVVMPDDSVWLGVDRELWHLAADGSLMRRINVPIGGGERGVANLLRHPGGDLLASVTGDPVLYRLDPETGQEKSRWALAWPSDLSAHSSRAVTYAVDAQGRVAVSTGGGHAVALFDPQGRFLGRTPAGTYRFTNGLWWAGTTLWTTDTNGMSLVALDPDGMAETQRITLDPPQGSGPFLGATTVTPPPQPGPEGALTTLVRLRNGMTHGHVADVWPDGRQQAYPTPDDFEPRGLAWQGRSLLVVDGTRYQVLRFGSQRQALAPFGSDTVQADLQRRWLQREKLQQRYQWGLIGAATLFLFGLGAALRARQLEMTAARAAHPLNLALLGTPVWTRRQRIQRLWLAGRLPLLLIGLAWIVQRLSVTQGTWRELLPWLPLAGLLGSMVLMIAASLVVASTRARFMLDADHEPLSNFLAMHWLGQHTRWAQELRPGERLRETLIATQGFPAAMVWLVMTDQRLLIYAANGRERVLTHAHERHEIVQAHVAERPTWRGLARLRARFAPRWRLTLTFRHGPVWEAHVASSVVTAQRMAALLDRAPRPRPASTLSPSRGQATNTDPAPQRAATAWRSVVASLLIPGLGQWMQRRNRSALLLFALWLLGLAFVLVPVLWTLMGPRAEVSGRTLLLTGQVMLILHLSAAWDAWRMRQRMR